ncbi:MAG: penicillin-binding protein activator [Novosphingobium sp.]
MATPALAARTRLGAALLVPKTGAFAALGRSMERAATLAQVATQRDAFRVFDTGGTPEGAAAAGRAARNAGVGIVFGPVFGREVPAVLRALGPGIPVVTFSNDAALIESGAFLLGLTARQSVTAALAYAAGRGIRRVAISGPVEGWGAQARAAALAAGPALGLECTQLAAGATSLAGVSGSGDGLPDAVLCSDPAALIALAPQLAAQGVQALAAFQALDLAPDVLARLEGAWIAAPDPARFAGFARAYELRNGSAPGAIAALAYDAANIADQLRRSGGTDRSALLAPNGFKAISGDIRFREDGSAARSLAILQVSAGGLRTVATQLAQ